MGTKELKQQVEDRLRKSGRLEGLSPAEQQKLIADAQQKRLKAAVDSGNISQEAFNRATGVQQPAPSKSEQVFNILGSEGQVGAQTNTPKPKVTVGPTQPVNQQKKSTVANKPLTDLAKKQQQLVTKASTGSSSIVDPAKTKNVNTKPNQFIPQGTGQLSDIGYVPGSAVPNAQTAATPQSSGKDGTYNPEVLGAKVNTNLAGWQGAEGQVSQTVDPAQGQLSQGAMAKGQEVDPDRIQKVAQGERKVDPNELAEAATDYELPEASAARLKSDIDVKTAAGKVQKEELAQAAGLSADKVAQAEVQQASGDYGFQAVQRNIQQAELPKSKEINPNHIAQMAASDDPKLREEARAQAAIQKHFTVDDGTLADFQKGEVRAVDTVQGQLKSLMKDFEDGTPEWAAGAMRAANAAMMQRGLGGSSLAGAAIVQAAMESAIPIAAADAQTFKEMNMSNLNRQTQVALANAAAQQNLTLTNLNNETKANLQNSMNAFNLQIQGMQNRQEASRVNTQLKAQTQLQNLENRQSAEMQRAATYAQAAEANAQRLQQQRADKVKMVHGLDLANLSAATTTVIANAQMKSAIQGKNLDNKQQVNLANAARYADVNNINLNNQQQSYLTESTINSQLDIADLSSRQATVLANLQVQAALEGKSLDNKQQAAIVNAERFAEANNLTFSADEQRKLYNSQLMQTVGLKELDSKSAAALQNSVAIAGMDMTNLNNRQQAAVQNANNFLQMDMANLSNDQQTMMFKLQAVTQGMFTDQAAVNLARQVNSQNQMANDQFFSNLKATVDLANKAQVNSMNQFRAGESNVNQRFNKAMADARTQFEASNSLAIAQSNAQWRRDIATLDTEADNTALRDAAIASYGITSNTLDNIWQRERDLMSFAFQAYENQAERDLKLFLGEKQIEEYEKDREAAEDAGRGALLGSLVRSGVELITGL